MKDTIWLENLSLRDEIANLERLLVTERLKTNHYRQQVERLQEQQRKTLPVYKPIPERIEEPAIQPKKARKPHRKNIDKSAYGLAQHKAIERGKKWDLDEHDYESLVCQPCEYCGISLGDTGVRLDRLDNTQGYTLSNVVPCCFRCNMVRGFTLSYEEMKLIGPSISLAPLAPTVADAPL